MLGIDSTLVARSKISIGAIANQATIKQTNGDPECYNKYMLLLDRISNLIYALDNAEFASTLTDSEQLCLYKQLFSLIQENNNIPGVIDSTFNTTLNGISHMSIGGGYGNLFIIN